MNKWSQYIYIVVIVYQRQPLPQQAHHGILPPFFECDVIDILRRDDDRWLSLPNDSRDDAMLLQIDVPVDSPKWSGSKNKRAYTEPVNNNTKNTHTNHLNKKNDT